MIGQARAGSDRIGQDSPQAPCARARGLPVKRHALPDTLVRLNAPECPIRLSDRIARPDCPTRLSDQTVQPDCQNAPDAIRSGAARWQPYGGLTAFGQLSGCLRQAAHANTGHKPPRRECALKTHAARIRLACMLTLSEQRRDSTSQHVTARRSSTTGAWQPCGSF